MAKTREQRRKQTAIPATFVPRFWDAIDGRTRIRKRLVKRIKQFERDASVVTAQQELLCQRAAFLAVQLETQEIEATETGKFDPGVYTQMTNTLFGILRALGLAPKKQKNRDLQAYVQECGA